ncbi:MAG: hypothetical protein J6Z40_11970, partial [Oscillospiraceae bacterium]|nr:hypothetical protein [Oscillospiraceae bacterium]
MTFTELREKYPEFRFNDIYMQIKQTEDGCVLHIKYHFSFGHSGFGTESFNPEWEIPCKRTFPVRDEGEILRLLEKDPALWRLVFSLGMAELVSYWKI